MRMVTNAVANTINLPIQMATNAVANTINLLIQMATNVVVGTHLGASAIAG